MIYKDYYEAIANRRNIWQADPKTDLYYQERIRYDAILKLIPALPKSILDLGCGDGYLSYLIAQKGHRVTGLDLAANRLNKFAEVAQKHQITQVIGEVNATAFAEQSFDLIVCSEVIEHIEDYQQVLDEAFRILKPAGIFIVTVPYREKLKMLLCPHCNAAFHENGHLHSFDKEKLSAVLRKSGFTILRKQTLRHRLLVQIQYHTKMKYGFILRNLDRLLSSLTPEFTVYLLMSAQKNEK